MHTGYRVVPPLLLQQEILIEDENGQLCHASSAKRLSCGRGAMQGSLVPPMAQRAMCKANRAALRVPGDEAKWMAQSKYACPIAMGERPSVNRDTR